LEGAQNEGMQNTQMQYIWPVGIVLMAVVAAAKHADWLISDIGLSCILLLCSIAAYFRWSFLKRQIIPETKGNFKKIRSSEIERIKNFIEEHIVGQSHNVVNIMQTLKRNISMINSERHLGSYLLAGPTGTGKTYFAQLLAEALYGRECLITYAMNQQGLSANHLNEILLKSLKKDPYRVVLLDEIDKASTETLASLYHFMESGQIMDPKSGEWFHCPGLVIMATTNAGADAELVIDEGKNNYALLDHMAVNSQMPKALLSRFDGIFWFGQLAPKDIAEIGMIQIINYYQQHGVKVRYLAPEAIMAIIKENQHFKSFGVRQLIQIVRHKSDPIIALAKSSGQNEINIISDINGNLIPQWVKRKKVAA
jgi:ATP-dependent Clp protease ATP-binding subunit ClpA